MTMKFPWRSKYVPVEREGLLALSPATLHSRMICDFEHSLHTNGCLGKKSSGLDHHTWSATIHWASVCVVVCVCVRVCIGLVCIRMAVWACLSWLRCTRSEGKRDWEQ
jgi:hypothetical protein